MTQQVGVAKMPNTVKKVGDKYRVVEVATGHVTKNESGTAVDGGGFSSEKKARAQATAINISQSK